MAIRVTLVYGISVPVRKRECADDRSAGNGKDATGQALPTILPPLTPAESLETTRIFSAMTLLKSGQALMAVRPFRPPHHSVSDAASRESAVPSDIDACRTTPVT